MAAVYFVTGLLLLLLGIGNAVMALSATIDIAFIVKSLNPTDLFSTPSVLGNSMIITGILSIIQYFTPTNAMLVAIYIFNIHTLTLLPISIFTSIYYYATIPRLNLATRQSIAIFAVIVLFYLSTIIISVYIAMQYFTDFITSRHYHKLSDLKEEQNSDRSINEGEIAFRLSSTKKIRNVAIFQLICSGVLIASGLADLFLFQGLYSNQTFYAGSLLCVTSICGILSEHKNIDEGMIWFGILSRVSRLICISTIGINVLAYLNTSAAALYEDPDNIRSLFICVSVLLVLGFLTSFYITLKLTSNIGFFNVISVWKKRRAEQSYKPELCSLTTVLSTIQFLAALFLWASGVAAMLYGKAQHLSFSTFSTASWVIVAAKVGVSLNRMKSVQIDIPYVAISILSTLLLLNNMIVTGMEYYRLYKSDITIRLSIQITFGCIIGAAIISFLITFFSAIKIACANDITCRKITPTSKATNTRKLTKDMGSRNMLTTNEDNNEQEDSRESAN